MDVRQQGRSYVGAEETDDFYMFQYKIETCPRRYSHDWTSCAYAHSGESARRRDPSLYRPIPCPESKSGRPCPRSESCKYAHNDFEYWLHPTRYRTEYCKQGPGCKRKVCFFAHKPSELRKPADIIATLNANGWLSASPTDRMGASRRCAHARGASLSSSAESTDTTCMGHSGLSHGSAFSHPASMDAAAAQVLSPGMCSPGSGTGAGMYSPGSTASTGLYSPGSCAGAGMYSPGSGVYSCRSGSLLSDPDASVLSAATAFDSPSAYLDGAPFVGGRRSAEGDLAGALKGLNFGHEGGEAFPAGGYAPRGPGGKAGKQLVLEEVCSALAGCNADASVLDTVDPGIFLRSARPAPTRPSSGRSQAGQGARRRGAFQNDRVMGYLKALMEELERGGGVGAAGRGEAARPRLRHGRHSHASEGPSSPPGDAAGPGYGLVDPVSSPTGQSSLAGPDLGVMGQEVGADGSSMDGFVLDRILQAGAQGDSPVGSADAGLVMTRQAATAAACPEVSAASGIMASLNTNGEEQVAYTNGYYDVNTALGTLPYATGPQMAAPGFLPVAFPAARQEPPPQAGTAAPAWSTEALSMAMDNWDAPRGLGLLPGAYSHCRGTSMGLTQGMTHGSGGLARGAQGLTNGSGTLGEAGQSGLEPGVRSVDDLLFGLPEPLCG